MPLKTSLIRAACVPAIALLHGCAALSPAAPAVAAAPAQWHAPLPHEGSVGRLGAWWRQFDDPLLVRLIDAAQEVSPSIASAKSRIEQSRASRVAAGAALAPSLNAGAGMQRGRDDFILPIATSGSASLQASWEIDLFGGQRAARDAAQARLDAAQAAWHDARVSVAAEVATSYVGLRACEATLQHTLADAGSRAETSRLTDISARSGLQTPANAALSRATAAQGQGNATQQRAQCELIVKSLVALTGIEEPRLRNEMAADTARLPHPAMLGVDQVPAQALAQRPDLVGAERDLVAASADVAQARAQRLPRVSLAGSISAARIETGMGSTDGTLWSFGPLQVSLPIFDGGTRRANVDAARARYDDAASTYRARLRLAVREVEEALVTLQSTSDRTQDAQIAAEGFRTSFLATETRQRGGLASLFELEDARRSDLLAQTALVELQRERVTAWISLYRALGGGWQSSDMPAAQLDVASR
jgi:NodT family efflux transporter outer membrane factor (OMF) lipoprotein